MNNGYQRHIGDYLPRADEEMTYDFMRKKKKLVYTRIGTANIKEALGFLKDWSTSLVQLDLAAIGAIGLFIGFSDFGRSPMLEIGHLNHLARRVAIAEVACVGLSALSFFISLYFGLLLLNSLPGAAQRFPCNTDAKQSDVFAIKNERRYWTIGTKSRWLRYGFLAGAAFFALFIGLGLCRATLTGDSGHSFG
jgi:hypothetical protein